MTMPITDEKAIKYLLDGMDEAETKKALKLLNYDWTQDL